MPQGSSFWGPASTSLLIVLFDSRAYDYNHMRLQLPASQF